MNKSEEYLHSLYQLSSILNSERNPSVLLNSIVKNTAKAIMAKACSVMILTPDKEVLLHSAAYGLSDSYLRKGPIKVSRVIKEVLEGKPVFILNAPDDERVLYREQARNEGIASMLSVPMNLRGKAVGVLRIYTATPYQFTENDMQFVEIVANLAAVALENIRAYDVLRKDYETFLRDMLQWHAELGNEWMMGEQVTPADEEPKPIEPG
jgi:GAF domain-containing protein